MARDLSFRTDDSWLEDELRALGRRLDLAPPPDVTDAVRRRLAQPATTSQPGFLRYAAILIAVAIAVLVAGSPEVRAAIADVFRFAGVEVHRSQGPIPRPTLWIGSPAADVAEASRRAGFQVRLPARLGEPDEVRVSGPGAGRPATVSLIYRSGPGRPGPGPDGVAARLDQFGGTLDPGFVKYIGSNESEFVQLGDAQAMWLPRPHTVVYVDQSGRTHTEAARLAGSTLVWQLDGVTLRLEGAFTRDEAVAVARSVR